MPLCMALQLQQRNLHQKINHRTKAPLADSVTLTKKGLNKQNKMSEIKEIS